MPFRFGKSVPADVFDGYDTTLSQSSLRRGRHLMVVHDGVVIASMAVILMFGLVQKWFISGLAAGVVKG